MSSPDALVPFVRDALVAGRSRADIAATLRQAGWTEEQTAAALGAFADLDYPVPVPRPSRVGSSKEVFQYLVLFVSLYLSVVYVGVLLFQLINLYLPDPADFDYAQRSSEEAIRWAIAVLIVSFPLFLYMSWFTGRMVRRDPMRRQSEARRALTFATLFIAVCMLIGDSVLLVYNLLSGELTTRFVLKSLVVGGLAGGVLGYYLWDLRRDEREGPATPDAR